MNNCQTEHQSLPFCHDVPCDGIHDLPSGSLEGAASDFDAGTKLLERQDGDPRANAHEAISLFTRALRVYRPRLHRLRWARAHARIGVAHMTLADLGGGEVHVSRAVDSFNAALTAFRLGTETIEWADIQSLLGRAWLSMPDHGSVETASENAQTAITAFASAHAVYTHDTHVLAWADISACLGLAWKKVVTPVPGANLRRAIRHLEDAVQGYAPDEQTAQWVGAVQELARTWRDLPSGNRPSNKSQAISCLREAIADLDREKTPALWGLMQYELGVTLMGCDLDQDARNISFAIDALENSLLVASRDEMPLCWARSQRMLGVCWYTLVTVGQGGSEDRRRAIEHYERALEVFVAGQGDGERSLVLCELGAAWIDLNAPPSDADLRRAIDCLQEGISLFDRESEPTRWALAHWQLGYAWNHVSGDRVADAVVALKCLEVALDTLDPDTHPSEHREVKQLVSDVRARIVATAPASA